jgi:hypothetical protein
MDKGKALMWMVIAVSAMTLFLGIVSYYTKIQTTAFQNGYEEVQGYGTITVFWQKADGK